MTSRASWPARIFAFAILVTASTFIVPSCLGATAVSVEARTDVPHRENLNVTFTVGAPGETENAEPTTETTEAWGHNGFIGSLTVVPSDENDGPLAVKAVLGVRRGARACLPPQYEGCIVARRKLRYLPNEVLRLPIILYANCEGVPCDENSTCNAFGACVPADVAPEKCATPSGCVIEGDPPPGDQLPPRDASSDDGDSDAAAGADDDASANADGAPNELDGSSSADGSAGKDGGGTSSEGSAPAGPGLIDCRGTVCSTETMHCCYSATTDLGACVPKSSSCPPGNFTMRCDGPGDCSAGAQFCCFTGSPGGGSACSTLSACFGGALMCSGEFDCTTGTCTDKFDDHYPLCTVTP